LGCDREKGSPALELLPLFGTSKVEDDGAGGIGDVDRVPELAKGCIDFVDLAPVE
jgi:hypothetical protein